MYNKSHPKVSPSPSSSISLVADESSYEQQSAHSNAPVGQHSSSSATHSSAWGAFISYLGFWFMFCLSNLSAIVPRTHTVYITFPFIPSLGTR